MPPRPLKFPATLASALRFMLPQKRPEDRMKIYREFIRASLWTEKGRAPTDEEVASVINLVTEEKFQSLNHVQHIAEFLERFVPSYESSNRRKRARAGAAKRWPKKV